MSLLLFLLSLLLEGEWSQGRRDPSWGWGWGWGYRSSLSSSGSQGQDRDYFLQVKRTVKVQEGLCVVVPCSFLSPENRWRDPTPAYGYWFKSIRRSPPKLVVATNDKDKMIEPETQGRFQLVGDVRKKNCSLMIKDVQWRDSAGYSFRVERGLEKFSFQDGFFLQVEGKSCGPSRGPLSLTGGGTVGDKPWCKESHF